MPSRLQSVVGLIGEINILEDAKKKIIALEHLVELAMETEQDSPLAWNTVNVEPKTAYSMMAAHVIDMFNEHTDADQEIVMMSVMIKLLVENFFLHLHIQQNNS